MYQLYEQPDGTYVGYCRIQDGTEKFTAPNLKEAVKSMKEHARLLNGKQNLKKRDIALYRQLHQVVVDTRWVQVEWPK